MHILQIAEIPRASLTDHPICQFGSIWAMTMNCSPLENGEMAGQADRAASQFIHHRQRGLLQTPGGRKLRGDPKQLQRQRIFFRSRDRARRSRAAPAPPACGKSRRPSVRPAPRSASASGLRNCAASASIESSSFVERGGAGPHDGRFAFHPFMLSDFAPKFKQKATPRTPAPGCRRSAAHRRRIRRWF